MASYLPAAATSLATPQADRSEHCHESVELGAQKVASGSLRLRQRQQCENPRQRMRGTVLLLQSDRSLLVDVDLLRANELIVYHCHEHADALNQFQQMAPDVVVAVLSGHDSAPIVSSLRALTDHATSIIVASVAEEREAARKAGADSFLLNSAPPADLLYEIRRALILRRSGRRLPWNW